MQTFLLDHVVDLMGDSVPNIRWRAVSLLPILKQIIRLPEDVDFLVSVVWSQMALVRCWMQTPHNTLRGGRRGPDEQQATCIQVNGLERISVC